MRSIKVYGADWCEDTVTTLDYLKSVGVPYAYRNVDEDPEAKAWVKEQNGGKQKTPTVDIGGKILVEPNERQLEEAMREIGVMHE